jgi:hypothetical protein
VNYSMILAESLNLSVNGVTFSPGAYESRSAPVIGVRPHYRHVLPGTGTTSRMDCSTAGRDNQIVDGFLKYKERKRR